MTTLLTSHLDQISLCSQSISSLPFPGPKPFTNALLSPNHDITALIRDTEQHERALFHLAPPPLPTKPSDITASTTAGASTTAPSAAGARRGTVYAGQRAQPKSRAVAAVLGGDLYAKTRREGANVRAEGEVDVGVLLEGAERLCGVYPIPDAAEKIASLRRRHEQLAERIAHYEDRVARNQQELQMMNRGTSFGDAGLEDEEEEGMDAGEGGGGAEAGLLVTREDLLREEDEIRELERKKAGLMERVEGMGRDLGGLMR